MKDTPEKVRPKSRQDLLEAMAMDFSPRSKNHSQNSQKRVNPFEEE
jgi:hypothetical protein